MKAIKENLNSILMSVCEIIIGILLLIDPVAYTSGVITIAGIILTAMGIISLLSYFRMDALEAARTYRFAIGLIEAAIGLFCIFNSGWFITTFSVLTLIYGVVLLVVGVIKLQWVIDMLRMKQGKWFLPLISCAVSLLAAVLIFTHPLQSTVFIWTVIALTLILEAVMDIVVIVFRSKAKMEDEEIIIDEV